MRTVLLKDIVIPAGTIFDSCEDHTIRYGSGSVRTSIGLTRNSAGDLIYDIDHGDPDLVEWFGQFTTVFVLAESYVMYRRFINKYGYKPSEYVFVDTPEKLRGANRNSPIFALCRWMNNVEYKHHAMHVILEKFKAVKYFDEDLK
jgi:hypothetical protein